MTVSVSGLGIVEEIETETETANGEIEIEDKVITIVSSVKEETPDAMVTLVISVEIVMIANATAIGLVMAIQAEGGQYRNVRKASTFLLLLQLF